MKFNITRQELESALEYTEVRGLERITLHFNNDSGVGWQIHVSSIQDENKEDITCYEQ